MSGFGTREIAKGGRVVRAGATGLVDYKPGGVTIDWSVVPAVAGADKTLTDDRVVKIGDKYLRYGQVLAKITASGKYGPYDATALDGRQTLTRGSCFILDETVLESDPKSDYAPGGVFDGGWVYKARMQNNADDLTLNPAVADIETAFPTLKWVE